MSNLSYWKGFLSRSSHTDSEKALALRKANAWEFHDSGFKDDDLGHLCARLEDEIVAILSAETMDAKMQYQTFACITLAQIEVRIKQLRVKRVLLLVGLVIAFLLFSLSLFAYEKREGYYKPPVLVASVSTVVAEETVMFENAFTIDVVSYSEIVSVGLLNFLGDRVDKYVVEIIDRETGEVRYSITFDKRYQKQVNAYFSTLPRKTQ